MKAPLEPDMEPGLPWDQVALGSVEPDGEPDLAWDLYAISEKMRSEVSKLEPAKGLASSITDISLILDVEPSPKVTMQAMVNNLTELQDLVAEGVGSPSSLSEPFKVGIVGEATVRARFGVRHLTELYSGAVAEELKPCLDEAMQLKEVAQHIVISLQELHSALITYSSGISSAVQNLEVLQQKVEALSVQARRNDNVPDTATASWKKALGLTAFAFEDLLRKLEGTQEKLEPLSTAVAKRIQMIREFACVAAEEIRQAFQVPPPACFCQAVTIGQEPRMKALLLAKLDALEKIDGDTVISSLGLVAQGMRRMRLEHARSAVKNFAACAGGQLNTLDAVLVRARLADQVVQQEEPEVKILAEKGLEQC